MHKIKKYANRKLYDATDRRYVTLEGVAELVVNGETVRIVDNTTGEDITAQVLSQILARRKGGKDREVPTGILAELLRKGPGSVFELGRRYASIWQSGLTAAEEELDRLIDRLEREKKIRSHEKGLLKKDVLGYGESLRKWMRDKIDQRTREILGRMHLPTRDELEVLSRKMESLAQKIEALEKRLEAS
ncbi:MAG: hypothetical protein JRF59_05000 [Deltaproteobacteria bacterium]|mgnify:CR=1 FL=1|nr:hypothetical protein [Deltaproteobacteria bacterium]MBW1922579.1 hypothetical protein [Deltaproteobacteria bacterium]MBW1950458.1 hypothetical protein [Deltaproteobacteria bacterium]MBW2007774.1 hypothetical protein [Deltaproteobacteria bacterium]MBW2347184.1 hypothetical protein [Deltaproteobacteria bacterium]